MAGSKPNTSIAPTIMIRRPGKAKWHIERDSSHPYYGTMCGQTIHMAETMIAYDARQIKCNECMIEAINRRMKRREGPPPKVTP